MNYQIRYNAASRLVRICYYGRMTLENTVGAADMTFEKYAYLRPLCILVDLRKATNAMTLDEQRYFGRYLARHPRGANARVAVLYNRGFNVSTVINREARTSGFCLAEFSLEAEALNWLRCRRL